MAANSDSLYVPGVFNCRFNQGIKRKKKKPTSFVPPPASYNMSIPNNIIANNERIQAFWTKPLPQTPSSDREGSAGSRVNIQQKLEEKKKQQIAELHQIEEEIRTGKLKRPKLNIISETVKNLPQPIPKTKKQPFVTSLPGSYPFLFADYANSDSSFNPIDTIRALTPEMVVAPNYFQNSKIYYEYQDPRCKYGNNYHQPSDRVSNSSTSKRSTPRRSCNTPDTMLDFREMDKKHIYQWIRTDHDRSEFFSRSNTLPKQFKYKNKNGVHRQTSKFEEYTTSLNSSDGE